MSQKSKFHLGDKVHVLPSHSAFSGSVGLVIEVAEQGERYPILVHIEVFGRLKPNDNVDHNVHFKTDELELVPSRETMFDEEEN